MRKIYILYIEEESVIHIFGACIILIGLFLFYMRYRPMIGGNLYKAKVVMCITSPTANFLSYQLIVDFNYKRKRLRLPVLFRTTFFPDRHIGKILLVYYNEKCPSYVTGKRKVADVFLLCFIASGLVFILGNFH